MNSKEFIEKLRNDEALDKKLAACKTPEEAYALAKENGLTDEADVFAETMKALCKQAKNELSDAELNSIVGGASAGAIAGGIIGGTAVIGLGAAGVAAGA